MELWKGIGMIVWIILWVRHQIYAGGSLCLPAGLSLLPPFEWDGCYCLGIVL
jgi:hypothetical protein